MLERRTLTSQVIDYILNLIKSGQVKPGDRLPTEKDLTKSLGVSRTCVREAFKSLESLQLVRIRTRVGAIVTEPSPSALLQAQHLAATAHKQPPDQLIEFRRILEVGLASLAAEKAEQKDLLAMKQALDDHKRACETDQISYRADIAFHMAIAAASNNLIVTTVFQTILERLFEEGQAANKVPSSAESSLRDHLKIFAAIKARNPNRARNAMRIHMDTAERTWRIAKELRTAEVATNSNGQATRASVLSKESDPLGLPPS